MTYFSFNGFRLGIPEAEDLGHQLAGLHHGQHFTIEFHNWGLEVCEVDLDVAGVPSGSFKLPAERPMRIERPADQGSKFVFFKSGSPEAAAGKQPPGDSPKAGLITAVFWEPPEETRTEGVPGFPWGGERGARPSLFGYGVGRHESVGMFGRRVRGDEEEPGVFDTRSKQARASWAAGGGGRPRFSFGRVEGVSSGSVSLQGKSSQRFSRTASERDEKTWKRVTIMLRLVCLPDEPDDDEIFPLGGPVRVSTDTPPCATTINSRHVW